MKKPDIMELEKIIISLWNEDSCISKIAVWFLGRIGITILPILESSIPNLLQNLSQFPSNSEILLAIHTKKIFSCIGQDGIPWVLSRIQDPDPDTFRYLLSWLIEMTIDERYIPELINLHSRLKDPMMQYRLLHFLGRFHTGKESEFLYNKLY
jgi:hypothetical protein